MSNDFVVAIGKFKKHEFDMMTGVWVGGPFPDDFIQTFGSESATGEGSNYSNFSNPKADVLMDSIRTELNEDKRSVMYKRLQEILNEELPMIFLWAPTERIAINKRFENANVSVWRPGYWEQSFKAVAAPN
jgi:peptide/nickel transport system substrate-binding protein